MARTDTTPPEMLLTPAEIEKCRQAGMVMDSVLRFDFEKAAEAVQRALLAKLREQQPVAWRVRRHDAPNYWIVFLHKPVDALTDPEREVEPLYAAPVPTPAAQAAQAVPAWQPIKTAPKGSRHILAHGDGSGFTECSFVASWGGEMRGWVESFTGRRAEPTHWMPLPAAPTPTEGQS